MPQAKILIFAGSGREGSFNKKLAKVACALAVKAGAQATFIDLKDYPMPLYDGDLEAKEGLPVNAIKLKELFVAHQALLIACPEYNSSITALLKNTIDWVSRQGKDAQPLLPYKNKVAALVSASPGALGGLRGLVHVRAILGNIGVLVIPTQLAVSKAAEAFNPDGTLKDPTQHSSLEKLVQELVSTTTRLTAG